jgi:sulfate-transporting ATPase
MTEAIQYVILGAGLGATYALLAQGLVATFWGSGVLNFAHAAIAMAAGYLFWELNDAHGWSVAPAVVATLIASALLGAVIYLVTMRPLRHASSLARVVVTLGLLIFLQGGVQLIWGAEPKFIDSIVPTGSFNVGDVLVPESRLALLVIAIAITAGLWAVYRFTTIGLAIRANAENRRGAASLGWSPDAMATLTWGVGSVLAGAAGILLGPLTGITPDQMPLLVIPALAAALIGGFSSFWLTLGGAVAVGIIQSLLGGYVHLTGVTWAVPLAVIVVLLALRGKGLPGRGQFVESLPAVGTGRVRAAVLAPAVALFVVLVIVVFPNGLLQALIPTLAWATIMLSIVVLLGYTTQLSFEQMGMAGLAALIAGRLVSGLDWPFVAAFAAALVAAVPVGVLFALPALRTRGVELAVLTLALGMVIYQMVFQNPTLTGGSDGTPVGSPDLFGFDIDAIHHPQRYTLFVFAFFLICSLVVANVRRGGAGRRLLAVRTNERAAAALGVSVFETKLFAFMLGSTMAAVGGVLLSFSSPLIDYERFNPLNSVLSVGYAVLGGVGFLLGPLIGGTWSPGGFGAWLLNEVFDNPNPMWLLVVGGVSVVGLVILHPDGTMSVTSSLAQRLSARRGERRKRRAAVAAPLPEPAAVRVAPATLEVDGLVVRYGGVTAVDDVSLRVAPGEVVGLIGPNGAGKTSMIDAITGFAKAAAGSIRLGDEEIGSLPVHRRARAGISRSFQSLELFEDATVRENLQVAADSSALTSYAEDLVRPRQHELSAEAVAAVRELDLERELDERVSGLSYGHRRLVAIARAAAMGSSVLLLDEPAAGLSEGESRELAAIVRRLADRWGMGILVVEHDMSFVMGVCDSIVVMDFGRPLASGRPAVIREDPAVIAAYLGDPDDEGDAPAARADGVGSKGASV